MVKILNEILKELPKEKINSVEFEAANIVIYTKDTKYLFEGRLDVKKLVSKYKKRIELRADTNLLLNQEDTTKIVEEILKENSNLNDIKFDFSRSKLTIEVDNVGNAIGVEGCNLKEIQKKTNWSVLVKRSPKIKSKTVDSMRNVEYLESSYRRGFLDKVGKKIYGGWEDGKIRSWARVSFLGSGGQVGRSSIYLQTQSSRILFDCGIDPTKEIDDSNFFPFLNCPEFKVDEIDAVVLSHAHMDHCGALPYLYKIGYRGPIYCTEPTRDLMVLSIVDFIKIMNFETSKKPLYTLMDVKEMLKHIITINYLEVTDITSDIRLTFYNAGHILGSAFCHINIGNGVHNFLYTADINYSNRQKLLNKAETNFPRIESMLLEGTLVGPQDHSASRDQKEEEFLEILINGYLDKSKILIPVFGIGRAQEMLLTIENFIREERLPKDTKVYVDGMVFEVNAIHSTYPEFLNYRLRNRILNDDNPFLCENFLGVENQKRREMIYESNEPCIIIATSGMLNGGTSVEYFKALAPYENNAIIFVGYQGEGTLGKRVRDGEKEILLKNSGREEDKIKVNLKVYHMSGAFSAHSDVSLTRKFLANLSAKPKKIMLNHGEITKLNYFSQNLKQIIVNCKTYVPENLEVIRLN